MCVCVCVCAYMQRGIVALFAKRAAIRRTCHIFRAKARIAAALTRQRTAAWPSKCGAFGGRKEVNMPSCFQVLPLRFLFDVYRMWEIPN